MKRSDSGDPSSSQTGRGRLPSRGRGRGRGRMRSGSVRDRCALLRGDRAAWGQADRHVADRHGLLG